MVSIGYGSNKKTRHMMPNGLRRLVVSNPRDVDLLLMWVSIQEQLEKSMVAVMVVRQCRV